MSVEGSNRRLTPHWTSLAEGNANFSIVIVFRYADDLMVWPRNLWSSGSASRPSYIVGKGGESRDSWRRRLGTVRLLTAAPSHQVSGWNTARGALFSWRASSRRRW